jgi:hypothetical protein
MARKNNTSTTNSKKQEWPKIQKGSHSIRTEYEDGTVTFEHDWKALQKDITETLTEYENSVKVATTKTKRKKKDES